MPTGADVLAYCESLDSNDDPCMTDCNAFVKKVGTQFGIAIPQPDADGIVNAFGAPPFARTTTNANTAMAWAASGLVVAGMTRGELDPAYGAHTHGHVAIVHDSADSAHPGFPMASWGTLGGHGASDESIRLSFPARACDDHAVQFAFAPFGV